jgi:hypothetical protein
MEDQWKAMASENQRTVSLLLRQQCWRSAISRAYYCTYARLVAALIGVGVSMPKRGNPSHAALPTLILENLYSLDTPQRGEISGKLMTLYWLRIQADYAPAIDVDIKDFRTAQGCMVAITNALKTPSAR